MPFAVWVNPDDAVGYLQLSQSKRSNLFLSISAALILLQIECCAGGCLLVGQIWLHTDFVWEKGPVRRSSQQCELHLGLLLCMCMCMWVYCV